MLKRFTTYLFTMASLALSSCQDQGSNDKADDVADIRAAYQTYVQALQMGDGAKAASMTDANTVAYYENMLRLAREADSTTVARLDVMDRITVLGLRVQAGDRLTRMDAREAIATGASSGMMGGEEMAALELGKVTVDGDNASAPIRMGGFPVPAKFHFQRENNEWKVDITPLFTISRMAFEQMAQRSGIPTNEWLMEMLEQSTGERPTNAIWHPAK